MTEERLLALEAQVEDVAATVARLESDLLDVAAAVTPATSAPARGQRYETLTEWVEQYFVATFARPVGGEIRWCPAWRQHPEAVERFSALWHSWEALHDEHPFGMANWLTTYLDPLFGTLLGRVGPFGQCSAGRHCEARPLQ